MHLQAPPSQRVNDMRNNGQARKIANAVRNSFHPYTFCCCSCSIIYLLFFFIVTYTDMFTHTFIIRAASLGRQRRNEQ